MGGRAAGHEALRPRFGRQGLAGGLRRAVGLQVPRGAPACQAACERSGFCMVGLNIR